MFAKNWIQRIYALVHNGLRIIEWAVVSLAAAYVRLEPAHNVS